ncbi:MAG: hypothetical protein JWN07_1062 [Hyphomicrobiales bacterium]|nr:hypothetical protein [Hyphomicrobiales bacterium]
MVTSRHIVDPPLAAHVEELPFPDLSELEKRALLDSLDEARGQIARGEYRIFDAEAILDELKQKYSSR